MNNKRAKYRTKRTTHCAHINRRALRQDESEAMWNYEAQCLDCLEYIERKAK